MTIAFLTTAEADADGFAGLATRIFPTSSAACSTFLDTGVGSAFFGGGLPGELLLPDLAAVAVVFKSSAAWLFGGDKFALADAEADSAISTFSLTGLAPVFRFFVLGSCVGELAAGAGFFLGRLKNELINGCFDMFSAKL